MLFFTLFLGISQNKVYTVDNIPNVHLTDKNQYVSNPDGVLSNEICDYINRKIVELENKNGVEIVVVAVNSIGEEECFDFSHSLLNKWGVGKKGEDNGLVVLLVTDQRCIHMYTGYGLEGVLTDAVCKRIQMRYMVDHFRLKDWNSGMKQGIDAIYDILKDIPASELSARNRGEDSGILYPMLLFFLVIILFQAFIFYESYKAKKCNKCGKHTLQRAGSRIISENMGVVEEELTTICSNCGDKNSVIRKRYRESNIQPPIFPGRGFGSFGGGSFGSGGGSFGGGRGGGGGAGSRF